MNLKNKKEAGIEGQSLLEVVLALVIIGLVLTGLMRVVVYSFANMEFSRNKNFSLNLAQSKAEELRKERDSSAWDSFWKKYFETLPNPQIEQDLGVGGLFTRTTTFEDISSEEKTKMKIIISLSWQDSKGTHESIIYSYLTKWK